MALPKRNAFDMMRFFFFFRGGGGGRFQERKIQSFFEFPVCSPVKTGEERIDCSKLKMVSHVGFNELKSIKFQCKPFLRGYTPENDHMTIWKITSFCWGRTIDS